MSRWSSFFRVVAAGVAAAWGQWGLMVAFLESDRQHRKNERVKRRSIQAYNDAQIDRLEMIERDPRLARRRCYGRVRAVEGLHRPWTSGTNDQILTMPVSFAGHEIDGFEEWFLFDKPVTLDGSGWVLEEPYKQFRRTAASQQRTGDGTVTLEVDYITATAGATYSIGSGESTTQGSATVVVTGTGPYTATVSGAPGGSSVTVYYERNVGTSHVRIRPYLGTATQNIGADLAAEYPGKITATDKAAGVAMAIVDCVFNPDVFPQGRPTPTAVFRGAKVYDPRKDSTVAGGSGSHRLATPSTWEWSRNPALIAYDWARYEFGCNINPDLIPVADVIAAANACDVSTTYTLRNPDTSTSTVTQARYLCDMVIPTDGDPMEALETIADTMNGRVVWSGGRLRMRAGTMGTAVAAIDKTWLVEEVDQNGSADGGPVITAAQAITRAQRWNRISGSCVDPGQRYQMLPYPAVKDATLIASKGARETAIDFPGVASIAQAQHLASMAIRQAQAGQRIEMRCGAKALGLELLDVFTLTLNNRHGITAKTYEVVGLRMGPDQPVRVQAAEISAALFTVDAELTGRDPAPDSDLREPWEVEQLTGLSVASGAAAVLDTSILTRTVVTWTAPTGEYIRNGGDVEIQFTPAGEAVPAGDWSVWPERGTAAQAVIPGLLTGRFYLFRGRFVQRLPLVHGPWSSVVRHQIAARRSTKIFRQTTAPTGDVIEGDEWFDTDDGNAYYVRVSGSWVATKTGTGGLEDQAATYTASSGPTTSMASSSPGPGDGGVSYSVTLHSLAWTNDTGAARQVQFEMSGAGRRVFVSGGSASAYYSLEYSLSGGGSGAMYGQLWTSADADTSKMNQVSVPSGQTITVTSKRRGVSGPDGSVNEFYVTSLVTRLTAIVK